MKLNIQKLEKPTQELVKKLEHWENDPDLIPYTRVHRSKEELEAYHTVTLEGLSDRLHNHDIYLIYLEDKLIGEMNFMIDPPHLHKKVPGTAWIGITIGEPEGRGKGVGVEAIRYLEEQINSAGLNRIELGVFEFNERARKLYSKMGYKEIARLADFTFWKDQMWADIRMEKIL
ncbi:GNAT family N-acetyltransferase [Halobacillus yeomjeoni]|uniref:GNAT family N-acetyltransferase n=1 Tax=Halobacillus yeomjeoni TaxID=311194 RepID=A0A931MUD4_9BACI|nr:GNAT family N-acetyltransferase [Halobacillus yeomjeoni]MBH0229440.1 GNAT family N-acetyltransferase [Halobacillus yeomjeoni]